MRYAQVVVNTPLAVGKAVPGEIAPAESRRERAFTYEIPEHLAGKIEPGQLVWIPFGARRLQGIVIAFSDMSPVEQTKAIDEIADARPYLSATQIDLAQWIARTYLCSLYDALSLMLPPGVEQPTEILLSLVPDSPRDDLTPKQIALVHLLAQDGETKLRALPRGLRAGVDDVGAAQHHRQAHDGRAVARETAPREICPADFRKRADEFAFAFARQSAARSSIFLRLKINRRGSARCTRQSIAASPICGNMRLPAFSRSTKKKSCATLSLVACSTWSSRRH